MTSRPGSAQGTCDPLQRARVLLNKSNIQAEFSDVPMYVEKCEKKRNMGHECLDVQ